MRAIELWELMEERLGDTNAGEHDWFASWKYRDVLFEKEYLEGIGIDDLARGLVGTCKSIRNDIDSIIKWEISKMDVVFVYYAGVLEHFSDAFDWCEAEDLFLYRYIRGTLEENKDIYERKLWSDEIQKKITQQIVEELYPYVHDEAEEIATWL